MNRNEFFAMVKDVHEHPEQNEAKPERTVKFLNAMLELTGGNAIKSFTLGVQENPGVLNDKTAIFDIYGTTEAGAPILIEVQQNYNKFFVDRLIYYTSRVFTRSVKKSQTYKLPHIYVLSILTENQFPLERNTYLHHSQLVRNRRHFYDKLDVYLIELEKFFAIEDRTPLEVREQSTRADMLRIFRDVLEEKDIPEEKLKSLLDKDFIKDVSLTGYTDEILLNEVDGMTDLLYERQGAYAQGHDDAHKEDAQLMVDAGILTPEKAAELFKVPKKEILPRNR